MKYYLINTRVDWADEFDVPFYEILNEEEYENFMYCKTKLKHVFGGFYFGTNEGWDDDFDFLDFTPIEISEESARVLKKYFPSGVENVYERLIEQIEENYDVDLYKASQDQFKFIID